MEDQYPLSPLVMEFRAQMPIYPWYRIWIKELHLSNSGDENEEDQENPTSSTPSRGTQDDEAQTAADLAETSLPVGEKENDDPSKTPKTPKKI